MTDPKKDIPTVTAPVLVVENKDPQPAPAPAKDAIPTVTAPVLVVEAPPDKLQTVSTVDHGNPPTVLDTQKIKKLILEAARLVTAEESVKIKTKTNIDAPKNPPYLLVILLMVVFGLGAIILLLTIRPDLDFVIVAGVILPTVTVITTSVFNIIQRNLTIQEAHEANVNSQLALVQSKETHDVVNSRLTEFKEAFIAAEKERSRNAAVAAYGEGRKDADARTDKLAGATG